MLRIPPGTDAMSHPVDQGPHPHSLPDHKGTRYTGVLTHLHEWLIPTSYFEIGTSKGESLSLANCAAVAVDPAVVSVLADRLAWVVMVKLAGG